jgi:hypothetical protein
MPRSNLSDEDGHSLTSDEEALGATSPVATTFSPNPLTNENPLPPQQQRSGIDRFRAAGRKVISMKTMSRGVGGESGVDVRSRAFSMLYAHLHDDCQIEVIDYSESKVSIKVLENKAFKRWINGQEFPRKPGMKVRWINVAGISWEIIQELGLKYCELSINTYQDKLITPLPQLCTLLPSRISFTTASSRAPRSTIILDIYSSVLSATSWMTILEIRILRNRCSPRRREPLRLRE